MLWKARGRKFELVSTCRSAAPAKLKLAGALENCVGTSFVKAAEALVNGVSALIWKSGTRGTVNARMTPTLWDD